VSFDPHELSERYRDLAEAGFDGIFVSCDLVVVHANARLVRLVGYDDEEDVLRISSDRFVDAESWARVQAMVAARSTHPYEVTLLHRDGTRIPAELVGLNTTWGGKAARLTGVRDLTARRAAESATRHSERRFAELVELMPVGVADADLEGRVCFTNPAGLAMFGYTDLQDMLGLHVIDDFIVPEERARARSAFLGRVQGDTGPANRWTMVRRDGTTFPCTIHVKVTLRDGRPIGLKGVMIDVTEQAEAEKRTRLVEEKMVHAQKLESLGVLAGGIAHDFNNLLVAVRGHAELAHGALDHAHPARRHVERIEIAAQRAAELTREMLVYAGKTRRVIERVNLAEIVAELGELVSVSIGHRTELEIAIDRSLPDVEADATQIRQIVLNLVTNAAEAIGDEPGTIRLRARFRDERVVLEVTDSGPGIPAELQARIFEPFFTTKFEGRGLGLAAVHGIVQAHAGDIEVHSTPGKGTSFVVRLPPAPGLAPAPVKPAAVGQPRGGTVLVIDDELDVREVAREMLGHQGYDVVLAWDGKRGVELALERQDLQCVLLDQMMPMMSGDEAYARIREARPELPIVVFSGFAQPDRWPAGPFAWLQKPFTMRELVAAIERARG
jgi:two-component system, cell cycle sensor histidine kinase and response regulator CckA